MEDFKVLGEIGKGAFASVFKVLRLSDNQPYALKQIRLGKLDTSSKNSALNQVRVLASVNHPNIISYKDAFFGQDDDTLNVVIEYAPRGDLSSLLKKHQQDHKLVPELEVWKALTHIARGLKYMHSKKIIHRDIKPGNILIAESGNFMVGDFNVSKVTKEDKAETMIGTPCYAAPEVWGDGNYGYKADVWSLGCVIYEMVTFEPPFAASTISQLGKKIRIGRYQEIPSCYSRDLAKIISLMLKVSTLLRLSSEDLLNHSLMHKNYLQLVPDIQVSPSLLIDTIHFDENNPNEMASKLPRPNYDFVSPSFVDFKKKLEKHKSERFKDNASSNIQKEYIQREAQRSVERQQCYLRKEAPCQPQQMLSPRMPPRPKLVPKLEKRSSSPLPSPSSYRQRIPLYTQYQDRPFVILREYEICHDRIMSPRFCPIIDHPLGSKYSSANRSPISIRRNSSNA